MPILRDSEHIEGYELHDMNSELMPQEANSEEVHPLGRTKGIYLSRNGSQQAEKEHYPVWGNSIGSGKRFGAHCAV